MSHFNEFVYHVCGEQFFTLVWYCRLVYHVCGIWCGNLVYHVYGEQVFDPGLVLYGGLSCLWYCTLVYHVCVKH